MTKQSQPRVAIGFRGKFAAERAKKKPDFFDEKKDVENIVKIQEKMNRSGKVQKFEKNKGEQKWKKRQNFRQN